MHIEKNTGRPALDPEEFDRRKRELRDRAFVAFAEKVRAEETDEDALNLAVDLLMSNVVPTTAISESVRRDKMKEDFKEAIGQLRKIRENAPPEDFPVFFPEDFKDYFIPTTEEIENFEGS